MKSLFKDLTRILFLFSIFTIVCNISSAKNNSKDLFRTSQAKERFASDVSSIIYEGWKKWQDKVIIKDINVEGSQGLLLPGDMRGSTLTVPLIMESFDKKGKSKDYIAFIRAIVGAVSNGMVKWQRGYENKNLSFPQGANAVITLSPSQNLPTTLDSGISPGDKAMTEGALYNYMFYRSPGKGEDARSLLKAASKALAEAFTEWKRSCSIVGIVASGGIGPQPAPMGPGPGPVRGAKGENGKLIGAYINRDLIYNEMMQ